MGEESKKSSDNGKKPEVGNPLGIDTTSLGSLKAEDLASNKVAANMLLNYTRSCESRITELETENGTHKTYADDYEIGKNKNFTGFLLNLIGTVFIGFGINFLTNSQALGENMIAGTLLLIVGIILEVIGSIMLLKR